MQTINLHNVLILHEHKKIGVAISRAHFVKSNLFLTLLSLLPPRSIPLHRSRVALQSCLTTCYAEREKQRLSPNFRAFLFCKTREHRPHSRSPLLSLSPLSSRNLSLSPLRFRVDILYAFNPGSAYLSS